MPRFASRIHVLLASHAPVGLVIRRGPSNSVATLLWDRSRDTFKLGQWLRGRMYERRSDLSPDGKHFIYFAMNGKWDSESQGAWTAISRAPYLKAIAFFPKGDCWHGGGLWTGRNTYWLNDGYGHTIARDTREVRRDRVYRTTWNCNGECLGVYYHRLLRDGWKFANGRSDSNPMGNDIFEKNIGYGRTLRKIAHVETPAPRGKSCYWDEHELIGPAENQTIRYPQWEWADLDGKRLVWAAKGKIYAGKIQREGLADEVELYDFNEMSFREIAAPY